METINTACYSFEMKVPLDLETVDIQE